MVEALICGKLKRNVNGLLGRVGIDPTNDKIIIAKLDSQDNKTQIQLIFKNVTELSILKDSIDIVLQKYDKGTQSFRSGK